MTPSTQPVHHTTTTAAQLRNIKNKSPSYLVNSFLQKIFGYQNNNNHQVEHLHSALYLKTNNSSRQRVRQGKDTNATYKQNEDKLLVLITFILWF